MPFEIESVAIWFFDFAVRHIARCPSSGWPRFKPDDPTPQTVEFFAPWIEAFARESITSDVADLASVRMSHTKFPEPGPNHLRMLINHAAHVRETMTEADGATNPETMSEEAAQMASRGCPECGGHGMATRKMRRGVNVYSVAWYCLCPLGEWLALRAFHNDKETFKRTRRLIQYPELWDSTLSHRSWPATPRPRKWAIESHWLAPDPVSEEHIDSYRSDRLARMTQEGDALPKGYGS